MAISKEDILEAVGSMTVMDLNDLVTPRLSISLTSDSLR